MYATGTRTTRSEVTPPEQRRRFCLRDSEVIKLAHWGCLVEEHYSQLAGHSQPMDLEWAKDRVTGELFIVQARPETVHSARQEARGYRTCLPFKSTTWATSDYWTGGGGKDRGRLCASDNRLGEAAKS